MATGSFKLPLSSASSSDWTRPADWLAMPTGITSANQTFVGLHAVIENSDNYVAFLFTTSAGQYRVDWGDGTITLHNSNTIAQYQYNYAAISNSTLTTFGYKQSMITVTAVSGNLLTCSFQQRYVTSPIQNQIYSTGFLDCILSMPNATSIIFGGSTVRHTYVQRFDVKTIGSVTSLIQMFQNCLSLKSIPLFNTASVTSMQQMFNSCGIQTVPLFNTASVTNMSSMFNGSSIQNVPLFNTAAVTTMAQMFNNCASLQSLPLFNTVSVTTMSIMFASCVSLNSIPALVTTSVSNFSLFTDNNSLNRIELQFRTTISITNCQLSQTALVEVFNNLANRSATTSATITISGNWGASALTAGERAIATGKNWVIVG